MKKFLPYILILIVLAGFFSLAGKVNAEVEGFCINAQLTVLTPDTPDKCKEAKGEWVTAAQIKAAQESSGCLWSDFSCRIINGITDTIIPSVVKMILGFVSLLTGLTAVILNGVIYYTVVKVSENYADIPAINIAWGTIRDIANMGFIFILLYAAIKTILGIGEDTQKLIVRIVVVAILINFSLFFTKIIIDISNVLALLFYDAIAPGALNATGDSILTQTGLSNSFMQHLSLQSLYKVAELSTESVITIGLMGSIMLLIAAFVFFAVALMFIIRYVVLILVLILSPIAFVSFVLPGLSGQAQKWWDALSGQAFFAPIYLMLTWITLQVLGGIMSSFLPSGTTVADTMALGNLANTGNGVSLDPGVFAMLINFIVIIVFIIASLMIAKEWANKAGPGVTGITKWAMGAASNTTFGGLGAFGRTTLGRMGATATESARLQTAAKEKTGLAGASARLALYASKKARSGSFDVRNAAIPTSSIGHVIEGTIGRTKIGKKIGLNEVRIPSMPVGAFAADQTGAGKGGTEGFRETQLAKTKRVETRDRLRDEEYRQVKDENDIKAGIGAVPGTPAYIAMEKALSKMSDKEVEAIVDSNRQLLDKQEFANVLSVKQLEALNKSDKFSDAEKDQLKDARFRVINTALAPGGAGAAAVAGDIKALSDTELDMINPMHLININFVGQLRGGQSEYIQNKSTKFTRHQKDEFKAKRREPLNNAIAAGNANLAQTELRKFNPKEITALGMGVMNNTLLWNGYTPNMLKRMATEMNTADIQTLRGSLLGPPITANAETAAWLVDPNTGVVDFS